MSGNKHICYCQYDRKFNDESDDSDSDFDCNNPLKCCEHGGSCEFGDIGHLPSCCKNEVDYYDSKQDTDSKS